MSNVTLHEDVIWGAIREAIAKIISGVDLDKAKGICKENIQLALVDSVDIKDAFICVHKGQSALQLQLGFCGRLSMVLDFNGNCISIPQQDNLDASSPDQKLEDASCQAAQAHQQF